MNDTPHRFVDALGQSSASEEPVLGAEGAKVRDRLWCLMPFGVPDVNLAAAVARAGALPVLEVAEGQGSDSTLAPLGSVGGTGGRQGRYAPPALWQLAGRTSAPLGIRIRPHLDPGSVVLPHSVDTVVVAAGGHLDADVVTRWRPRRVVVEVLSVDQALQAASFGADGVLAKGAESGGRVGDSEAFVLLQGVMEAVTIPCWCQGGIGLHTAAAAVAGGAAGVVLDAQLARLGEATVTAAIFELLGTVDGSETTVRGGHRLFARPDLALPAAEEEPNEVACRLGIDLPHQLLALGQDAAFAAPLARRFQSTAKLVRGLRRAMDLDVSQALEQHALGEGAPFAQRYGLRYPIAQGPMTRVSDRPGFAAAVAEGGALPFLALALMDPASSLALLQETSEMLGERTWGVGILGFVPPELRAGQLEAIAQVRPPVALIAGGRPSHARPLEDAGIATFLHVPSPGLLELFMKEGARRFVFEGRACGGHVGPRSSFVLWEQQIATLLEGEVEGMDVLFAGGIHDGRSAAMVAAMAAPLAARGARVGVVMGTAYLLTHEAVNTGAIGPIFQQVAQSCRRTVLLETGPGHATRCADSNFARTFEQERRRLQAEGLGPKERWAALEDLNLGRLRLAAKGIRRRGDQLEEVDHQAQRQEGMYMMGAVAELRHNLSTLAELHRDVSGGARRYLARGEPAPPPAPPQPLDVAIVGMACIFPGAADGARYWSNIVAGTRELREVPPERWDPQRYTHKVRNGERGTLTTSRWGGFLPPVPFDPLRFGIPPRALSSVETAQLLSLEVADRALADAGYGHGEFDRSRTAVVFGAEGASELATAYGFRALAPTYLGNMPEHLDNRLPALTEDSFPGVLTNVIAGRIANRLDLGGANYTVDAACAASLAAVRLACAELSSSDSDLVLCGGVDLHNGIFDYQLFASVHALSPTGSPRPFDRGTDGIALGEGVACVVLKRLADAVRDGDRIYAVIRGIGASSDGRSLGLTAPRTEGQAAALHRAYRQAGLTPADVGLVEAHGTGTVVGDRTELVTLTEVFTAAGAPEGSCALGSVKGQIGHTKCAAGLAGLIKAARSLYHGVRPGMPQVASPIDPLGTGSPFTVSTESRPWPDQRRVAGVSAFGFGGANFHVVMSSHGCDPPVHGLSEWPAELVVLRSEGSSLRAVAEELAAELNQERAEGTLGPLRSVASRQWHSGSGPLRGAIVARDLEDLLAKLDRLASSDTDGQSATRLWGHDVFVPTNEPGPSGVALLFPGQGSQRPGMLQDLFTAFPRMGGLLRSRPRSGEVMFPPVTLQPDAAAAQQAALTDTAEAQPALGIAELAAARLLGDLGVQPEGVGGHSYGELVALCVAGVFQPEELLELSDARAAAVKAAIDQDPGAMAAVRAPVDEVGPALQGLDRVVVANDNSPSQVVISGPSSAVHAAVERLRAKGMACRRLPVACGFHSPLMLPARQHLASTLAAADPASPGIPVWSNALGSPYPADPQAIRQTLAGQVAEPVRFRQQVESMYQSGLGIFVEAGPGTVLSGLVAATLGGRPHQVLSLERPGVHGVVQLLRVLGALVAAGVSLSLDLLFVERCAPQSDHPLGGRFEIEGPFVRHAGGAPVPGGLLPAIQLEGNPPVPPTVPATRLGQSVGAAESNKNQEEAGVYTSDPQPAAPAQPGWEATSAPAPPSPAHAVMVEHLRGLREVVRAQREAMVMYLGAGVPGVDASFGEDARMGAAQTLPLPPQAHADGYHAGPQGTPQDAQVTPALPQGVAMSPAPVPGAVHRGAIAQVQTPSPPDPSPSTPAASTPVTPMASQPPLDPGALLEKVTALVAERTGYPVEMLGADLDLEADLSIDSIKRIEIVGALASESGTLGGADWDLDDALTEELAAQKTLTDIVGWILARQEATLAPPGAQPPSVGLQAPTGGTTDAAGPLAPGDGAGPDPLGPGGLALPADPWSSRPGAGNGVRRQPPDQAIRYVQRLEPTAEAPQRTREVQGVSVALTDDGLGISSALAGHLGGQGARVQMLGDGQGTRDAEVLVHLASLSVQAPSLHQVVSMAESAVEAGVRRLLLVSGTGGCFGRQMVGGGSGLLPGVGLRAIAKTLALEHPGLEVRCVDIEPKADPELVARQLAVEVGAGDPLVEVGYQDECRNRLHLAPEPLVQDGHRGVALGSGAVVLLTGGARGITGLLSVALASRGCRVELVGRTPLVARPEDPTTAGCFERRDLRRALIAAGEGDPGQIEARIDRLLAERQVRSTLATIEANGGAARYHQADVRQADEVAAVVADVYRRHRRLDAVVHGAGVLEDHLARHKDAESFDRVFDTKVEGARALLESLRPGCRAVVLFGSVAGVFGNRGQIDYAAANEALEALAWQHNGVSADRVVCMHFGPWAQTGMTSPEVARVFEERGVGLIDPDEGIDALLAELALGPPSQASVLLLRAEPQSLSVTLQ